MNDGTIEEHQRKVPLWMSRRLGTAVFLFFVMFWMFTMRVNMNMSIVCMVNHTAIRHDTGDVNNNNISSKCTEIGNVTVPEHKDGTFVWDRSRQATILGAYFWPYALFQIPAGILTLKIGAYRVLGFALFLISLFTIVMPVLSNISYIATAVLRGLIGFVSTSMFVGCQYLLSRWVPLHERSRLSSFCFIGIHAANIITYVTSGVLCKYGFDGGWPSIFYIHGVGGFIFCFLWFIIMSDTAENARGISQAEKEYIRKYISEMDDKEPILIQTKIPWKGIVTSLPVYAFIVAFSTNDWSWTFMETYVPTYLDDIFSFDLETIGLISALPPIFILLVTLFGGMLSDYIQNRFLSRTKTRKMFSTIAMVIPASLMLALGYVDCSRPTLGIVLLISSMGLRGFRYAGYCENALDIDPRYASIIFGIANTVANLTGFLVSVMVGSHIKNSTREEWQFCFYISSGIEVFGALFYLAFASSNVELSKDKDSKNIELVSVIGCQENVQDSKIEKTS